MLCRFNRRLYKHLGRRGSFLVIAGLGEAYQGIGFILEPPGDAQSKGLSALARIMPVTWWGWLWVVCGLVAVVSAFARVTDWPGYASVVVPVGVWSTSYLVGALADGYARGLFVSLWYFNWLLVMLWASRVPDFTDIGSSLDGGAGKEDTR